MNETRRPESAQLNRRSFMKRTAMAAGVASPLILPNTAVLGADAPSNKLNIALIGAHGRGTAHYNTIATQNVVALCDIDEEHLALAAQEFPQAKHYIDWRECLDHPELDAVVICTLDHTHAFVANWAMNRDLHVYCEKPVAVTVEEARVVRAKYLEKKDKLATQMGTQRHAYPNFNRVRELILDGAIGELQEVHAWGNRQLPKPGYLPAAGEPPKTLHYDLWLGPAPYHPYNPEYFSGDTGMNCLQWNMYWDFGNGQVGDMGSHTMDLAWNGIDAGLPTSAEATGDPFNPEVTPVKLAATFEHPANDWRGPITVSWHQGGAMPQSPKPYINLDEIGHGAMFKGDRGYLISSFNERLLFPNTPQSDMTYYTPRNKDDLIPPLGDFMGEWIDACKGDLKTTCDFDYSGTHIEQMILGLVAYQVGEKIAYDGKTGKTGNPKADKLLRREYRDGWTLEG